MPASFISAQSFDVIGSANPSLSVTVPSGATNVTVLCVAWNNAINITASTLNGVAAANTFGVSAGGGAYAAIARNFPNPSIGSGTLALTFNETPTEGVVWVIYSQGAVTTGWMDADGFGDTGPSSFTLDTASGAIVFVVDNDTDSTPPNESGFTSIGTLTSGNYTRTRARYILASGSSTTVTCQASSGHGLVGVAFAAATAGSASLAVPRRMARMSSHFR